MTEPIDIFTSPAEVRALAKRGEATVENIAAGLEEFKNWFVERVADPKTFGTDRTGDLFRAQFPTADTCVDVLNTRNELVESGRAAFDNVITGVTWQENTDKDSETDLGGVSS